MRLVILDNYDKASEWAAKYVRNSIRKFEPGPGKYFVLGLPTGSCNATWLTNHSYSTLWFATAAGSTPLGMYRKLVEFHKKSELSFKYVKTFNMDEYVGRYTSVMHPPTIVFFNSVCLFQAFRMITLRATIRTCGRTSFSILTLTQSMCTCWMAMLRTCKRSVTSLSRRSRMLV